MPSVSSISRWMRAWTKKVTSELNGGFYRVSPNDGKVSPFWIWLPNRGGPFGMPNAYGIQAKHVFGELEPAVTEKIVEGLGVRDTFWNIGAGWGYHTLIAARKAKNVLAFEALPNRVEKIRRSARKNGLKNVQVVEGTVGEDIDLHDFAGCSPPDLILMDVEGGEHKLMDLYANMFFESNSDIIVEIHDKINEGYSHGVENIDPEGVIEIAKDLGYKVEIFKNEDRDQPFLHCRRSK